MPIGKTPKTTYIPPPSSDWFRCEGQLMPSQRSAPREYLNFVVSSEWADILREQAEHHGVTVQLYLAELVVDWIRRNGLEK